MTALTTAMLAQMRAQIEATLGATVVIQTVSTTSDGAGGFSETWTAAGTVAGRFDPLPNASQIARTALAEGLKDIYILTMPYNAPISAASRVVANGETYEVRQLWNENTWRSCRRAYVSVVR